MSVLTRATGLYRTVVSRQIHNQTAFLSVPSVQKKSLFSERTTLG